MKIYVVSHATFENTNVFYTSEEAAKQGLKTSATKYKTSENEWEIITLEEGVEFESFP